ncbi:MAG: FIST N-terminal domain-containing protein [Candidatus Omnitrophota bacterium]
MENVFVGDVISVSIGLSREQDPVKAVREAMQQARAGLSREQVSLAVVFSTINLAHPATLEIINTLLGEVPVIGCTGAALITNKGIFSCGLAIVLLSLPKATYFNTALVQEIHNKTALAAGEDLGEKLLHNFHGTRRDLGIVFCDGLVEEGWSLIHGLQERLGTSFPLIAAFAADNLRFAKSSVYFNRQVSSDAATGILWGGRLDFSWGIRHGWKPLGKPHLITRSAENVVYDIDTEPAAKVYADYLGVGVDGLKKELKRISVFYPMGIYLPGIEEYLLRSVKSIGEDGSLVFHGNIPQDSTIRLMIGTKDSCLDAAGQALSEAKAGLQLTPENKVGIAFIFESVSRYLLFGRDAEKELKIAKETLGKDTPIIGIYTYGEQAPLRMINYQGKTYFHNQTITVLAIGG